MSITHVNQAASQSRSVQHVLWINDTADFHGGCEQYIFAVVQALKTQGIRSSLLYDVDHKLSYDYCLAFDGCYPLVAPELQIASLEPDVVYVHRLKNSELIPQIVNSEVPTIKFFHDHQLFCLREHKYTAIGSHVCTSRTGLGCYSCLGFLKRSSGTGLGISIETLGSLERQQRLNRMYDHFVVGSDYMKDQVALHDFPSNRIDVLELFAPPSKPKGLARDEKRFFFAGTMVRAKGVDLILNAFAKLPADAKLVLAGTGHQQPQFEELSRSLNINERCKFVGKLKQEEMANELEQAAVVLFPSRSPETFGLMGVEAMSYATPVIASNIGGIPQWLMHEVNGMAIEANNADSLAAAMMRIYQNPKWARELGEAGQSYVRERFQLEHHLPKLLNVFEAVKSGSGSAGKAANDSSKVSASARLKLVKSEG